ncbi:MAG: GtrA family protein [Ignavibacteria bacterium]|nr:GtrA family protein [Ignavibacteria bacterium]
MPEYKLTNPLMRQIILFSSVGVVCYFVSIALLMFFVELTKMEVNLANVFASIITIFICYLLNARFVFKGGRYPRSKEVFAFFVVAAFGFLLNVMLMYLMTTFLPIWYVISKTLVTGVVAVFNFMARKKFVFLR